VPAVSDSTPKYRSSTPTYRSSIPKSSRSTLTLPVPKPAGRWTWKDATDPKAVPHCLKCDKPTPCNCEGYTDRDRFNYD
jgi:hypothetical protein